MLNRACRILNPQNQAQPSSTGTSRAEAGAVKFSLTERLSMWKRLLLKVFVVFQTLQQQAKAKVMLGAQVFSRVFQSQQPSLKEPPPTTAFRFVRGEAVGKQLVKGEGSKDRNRATMDPAICQHPDHMMQARGNKNDKWWTCKACLQRWERLKPNEMPNQAAISDVTLMTAGKHMGSTFQEILEKDPAYCQWAVASAEIGETSEPVRNLATYIHMKQIAETYEADPDWETAQVDMEEDL